MICFPNAKINLGLQVTRRREDGFHNLRSVFFPVPLFDVLEFKRSDKYSLTIWKRQGAEIQQNNLITKAWQLLVRHYNIPPVEVHLLKNIPLKSGLGGGSADALFFVREVLSFFNIEIDEKKQLKIAVELCSDCSFFSYNKPAYVIGRGNVVEPVGLNLSGYYLMLVFPPETVSTPEAFKRITPKAPEYNLKKLVLEKDFSAWRKLLVNDFESVLPQQLLNIKTELYRAGALYASLTGSGSAFYGIFDRKPNRFDLYPATTVLL